MKLLPATSFFFFLNFFISCTQVQEVVQEESSEASILEYNITTCGNKGYYDVAIYYAEELLDLAKRNNDSSLYKIAYDGLSKYNGRKKRYDLAIFFTNKLNEVAIKTNDSLKIARAKWKKGFYYRGMDSLKLSYSNYVKSKEIYLKLGDTIKAGKALLEIANILKKQGNYGISQLSASEGLEYLENSNELKSISGLYQVLAVSSKETGKYKIAEEYINKALALTSDSIARKRIGEKNIVIFKNTKANIFKATKQYHKATIIYNELLEDKKGDTLEIKRINSNLAYTLFLKNGFNKISDSLLKDGLLYIQATKNTSALLPIQLNLARIYRYENPEISSKYASLALNTAEKKGNLSSIYEALEIKINNSYTVEDFDRFVALGKELESREEDLNYFYIHERFNYNKIENKAIVAENKTIIAENKVEKSNVRALILLLILLIVLVATYFIYQRIQRRHKIEKVKTIHNTEARISTKVHDELANDVYKLMTQLETSEPDREMVLDKLDTIYNNARDISKQIQNVDTGKGFADELNNLLRSYQSEEVNVLLKRYEIEIWKDVSEHIKTTIYRVLQELLTNMKKHSDAGLVVVSIEKNNKKLFIQYIDNGKGFSEEISKNGLQNAENRIHAIQGSLTFDTELHKGCKFSINVPV